MIHKYYFEEPRHWHLPDGQMYGAVSAEGTARKVIQDLWDTDQVELKDFPVTITVEDEYGWRTPVTFRAKPRVEFKIEE